MPLSGSSPKPKSSRRLLTIDILNVHQDGRICDYDWVAYVNQRIIAEGTVKGHNRDDGWIVLVEKLAKQYQEQLAAEAAP